MKINYLYISILILFFLMSCSSQPKRKTVTISASNIGVINLSHFDKKIVIYNEVSPKDIQADHLNIHQGHFLKLENNKADNELILKSLSENQFHLVNLSLEDIAIATLQKINFEDFPKLIFLNSSIVDLKTDQLYTSKNVVKYYQVGDVGFIGLSDNNINKKIDFSRFVIADPVLSILKIKKNFEKAEIKSFVLIHHFQDNIAPIMERLPPSFINSITN